MDTTDLLDEDERAEVARAIAGAAAHRTAELTEVYVQARVAGLCREGAIEHLRDALGRAQSTR